MLAPNSSTILPSFWILSLIPKWRAILILVSKCYKSPPTPEWLAVVSDQHEDGQATHEACATAEPGKRGFYQRERRLISPRLQVLCFR